MKTIFFAVLVVLVVAAGYLLWPKAVALEASGKLQDGSDYRVSCALAPVSGLPFGDHEYRITSLELTKEGLPRAVPSAALADVKGFDPKRSLQVSEEGPVVVVTTQSRHPVQWRFLNGQFAQRRILKAGQQDARNFQAALDRPSIIGPAPQGSARTLHSPSLLSPDNPIPSTGNP